MTTQVTPLKLNAGQVSELQSGDKVDNWVTASTTNPGGSTREIQYNNAGSFGGVGGAEWNGTTFTISSDCEIAAGSFQLSFFGASIVSQPSTTGTTSGTNTGVAMPFNTDGTATGGIGTSAYTIGDVVLALKQLGLLAM